MDKPTDLQHQLRAAIQASGQSLNHLGQAASVDSGRLSRFMRGERDLTLEAVARLCQVLGLKFCPDQDEDKPVVEEPAAPRGRPRKDAPGQAEDKPARVKPAATKGKKRKGD